MLCRRWLEVDWRKLKRQFQLRNVSFVREWRLNKPHSQIMFYMVSIKKGGMEQSLPPFLMAKLYRL
jgi:hypothetical protein